MRCENSPAKARVIVIRYCSYARSLAFKSN
jgi:hypothetical protein